MKVKEFLNAKFTVEKVVWGQLIGSIILGVCITYLFYLGLTEYREPILNLLLAVDSKETAKEFALIMLPFVVIICIILEFVVLVTIKRGKSTSKKSKRK